MKYSMIIVLFCLSGIIARAQPFRVDYIHGKNYVYSLGLYGEDVWVGGYLGLTRINTHDFNDCFTYTDVFIDKKSSCFGVNARFNHQHELITYALANFYLLDHDSLHSLASGFSLYDDFYIDDENAIWFIDAMTKLIRIDHSGQVSIYDTSNSCLSSAYANCVTVKNGVVWIGTDFGLIRMHGNDCQTFNINEANRIECIVIDSQDNVWVASHGWPVYPSNDASFRLAKISGTTITVWNKNNSPLPYTTIFDLELKGDILYLCTMNGLIRFDGNTWNTINKANSGILSDVVYNVCFGGDTTWIGTDQGLSMVTADTTINIKLAGATMTGYTEGPVIEDNIGRVYVCTQGYQVGNVSRHDSTGWHVMYQGGQDGDGSLYSACVDSNNVFWATVYSSSGEVIRIEDDSLFIFNHNNSPLISFPSAITVDRYNNKWISDDTYLYKYDDSGFTIFSNSDFQYISRITSLKADRKGNLWAALGQKGLLKYDGLQWKHFDDSFFGQPYSELRNLLIDSSDVLWFDYRHGSIENRIGKIVDDSLIWVDVNGGLPEEFAGLLAVENDGVLWYSGMEGLYKYERNQWHCFNGENSRLADSQVWSMMIDRQGYHWISTYCCIERFHEDSLYHPSHPQPPGDTVSGMHYQVFPNPSGALITLHPVNSLIISTEIKLYDLRGAVVMSVSSGAKGDIIIDLGTLSYGIYWLTVNGNHPAEVYKVIKL